MEVQSEKIRVKVSFYSPEEFMCFQKDASVVMVTALEKESPGYG